MIVIYLLTAWCLLTATGFGALTVAIHQQAIQLREIERILGQVATRLGIPHDYDAD